MIPIKLGKFYDSLIFFSLHADEVLAEKSSYALGKL
jgi:hypothetical protein